MAQRKSTPDLGPLARHLAANPEADVPSSIAFDSLKSLPTSLPWTRQLEQQAAGPAGALGGQRSPSRVLEQGIAELVARLLRQRLELTLFGFDIVISDAGESCDVSMRGHRILLPPHLRRRCGPFVTPDPRPD